MLNRKRIGLVAAATAASIGILLGSGTPASAATVKPNTPTFCTGNYLCVNEPGQSLSTLYFDVWAARDRFYGHFEIQTPEHTVVNSHDIWNYPSGGVTFALPVVYGNYCFTAWQRLGPGRYNKLGYGCLVAGA
jgi:hypothetical protein